VKDQARGVDGIKNRSGKCEGPGRRGGTNGCLKRKVFLKNQKHQPNIVEITHLCIMHRVHTSYILISSLLLAKVRMQLRRFSALAASRARSRTEALIFFKP
jgi:hypothetical protein